jgi:hypothetical protein
MRSRRFWGPRRRGCRQRWSALLDPADVNVSKLISRQCGLLLPRGASLIYRKRKRAVWILAAEGWKWQT